MIFQRAELFTVIQPVILMGKKISTAREKILLTGSVILIISFYALEILLKKKKYYSYNREFEF